MPQTTELRFKQIIRWLAASIALVVGLLMPLGYFYTGYQYISRTLQLKTDITADEVSAFVFENPDIWVYQEHRLEGFLRKHYEEGIHNVMLFDTGGRLVMRIGEVHDSTLMSRSTRIMDMDKPVSSLTMQISLGSLYQRTFYVFLAGIFLGLLVYQTLYYLPLKALMSALSKLDQARTALEVEVLAKQSALDEANALGAKLHKMAMHDTLTDLPNRIMFNDRLNSALLHAERHNSMIAVVMMDLNHFKEVNDSLGHHAGDKLLIEVSRRLRAVIRKADTIARLGGDEFALLMEVGRLEDCEGIVNKILHVFRVPVVVPEYQLTINVGASCGIAVYPTHGDDGHRLLQRADVAMYAAKRASKGFAIYDLALDNSSPERLRLVNRLHQAIDNDELFLVYQPQLDLASAQVVSVEALLRWELPGKGLVPPVDFIPWAEGSSIIHPLTQWVLGRGLDALAQWLAMGLDLSLSVNVSGKNLQDAQFYHKVVEALARSGVEPQRLTLEITESAMIENLDNAKIILRDLRDKGVRLSIDDFGTGHASLIQLKHFTFHELKIDRSFVEDMLSDANDLAIVRAAIALSKSLGIRTVAEGIESQAVADLLQSLGCDYAQGFYFCKPLQSEDLLQWLGTQDNALLLDA